MEIKRLSLEDFLEEGKQIKQVKKIKAHNEYKKYYYNRTDEQKEEYNKRMLKVMKERRIRMRLKALLIISNNKLECNLCGCNDLKILEINHINGGGHQEVYKYATSDNIYKFYNAIISGKRSIDDLEVLCKICNALHYVQKILGIQGHEIRYTPP
jgi:hypothetical protein